jgi:hypothetical protein
VDVLAKLKVRQPVTPAPENAARMLALAHVEVESPQQVAPLRPRRGYVYEHLRRLYRLPVLPIGLYPRAGDLGLAD